MKQKIKTEEFNDKNFWMMFTPTDAIEFFIPNHSEWRSKGITLTIQDLNQDHRYVRHIEIWAEGDADAILLMQIKGFDK
jgi:hypothetical protein